MIPEGVELDNCFYYCEEGKENEMQPINNKGFKVTPTIELKNIEEMSETILGLEKIWSSTTKIKLSKLTRIKMKELFYEPINYKKLVNRRKKFGKRRNVRWK